VVLTDLWLVKIMRYSKKRAYAQTQKGSLKSKIVPVGTVINFQDINRDVMKSKDSNEQFNDTIIGNIDGFGKITIPVREYLKMKIEEGNHFKSESDSDDIDIPNAIKIISMEPRVDKKDNPIYPVFAYKLATDFLNGAVDWYGLVEGGLIDNVNDRFDQVQNYTIEILG
jgi:hypothetical protein